MFTPIQSSYLEGNFASCVDLVQRNPAGLTHNEVMLGLLACLRTDKARFAARLHAYALERWRPDTFLGMLVDLIFDDDVPLDDIQEGISSPTQECQFHFYLSQVFAFGAPVHADKVPLRKAGQIAVDCIEQKLACALLIADVSGEVDFPEKFRSLYQGTRRQLNGRQPAAAVLAQQCFEYASAHRTANSPEVVFSKCLVGRAHLQAGRHVEALPYLREGVDVLRKSVSADDVTLLEHQNELACVLRHCGETDGAEELYRDTWERRSRLLGPGHEDTLVVLDNLAYLVEQNNRLVEAASLLAQVVTHRRRDPGIGHKTTLNSLDAYAGLLEKMGRLDEALATCEDAASARRTTLGAAHQFTLDTDLDSLRLALKTGRPALAQAIIERMAATDGNLASEAPAAQASALDRAAQACRGAGAFPLAVLAMEKAVAAAEDNPAMAASQLLTLRSNLVVCLEEGGRLADAQRIGREVSVTRVAELGADHPDVALSYNNVSGSLEKTGDREEALELLHAALKIDLAQFGPMHDVVAADYHNLAAAYLPAGNPAEAIHMAERAMGIWQQLHPQGHINTAIAFAQIGLARASIGQGEAAIGAYRSAQKIFATVGQKDHPYAVMTAIRITLLREADQRLARADNFSMAMEQFLHPETAAKSVVAAAGPEDETLRGQLARLKIVCGRTHSLVAEAAQSVATQLAKSGEAADAIHLLESALEDFEAVGADTLHIRAALLGTLAECLVASEREDLAVERYRESVHLQGGYNLDTGRLWALGIGLVRTGKPGEGMSLLLQAENLAARWLRNSVICGSEEKRRELLLDYEARVKMLMGVARLLKDEAAPYSRRLFEVLLRFRAASREKARKLHVLRTAQSPKYAASFQEIDELKRNIYSCFSIGEGSAPVIGRLSELTTWRNRLSAVEHGLLRQTSEYDSVSRDFWQNPLDALGRALSPDVDVIEFCPSLPPDFRTGNLLADALAGGFAAFLYSAKNREVRFIDLGDGDAIYQRVQHFLDSITGDPEHSRGHQLDKIETPVSWRDSGMAVYDALWAPLASAGEPARSVVIAPCAVMDAVPFAAIPRPDWTVIGDTHRITYEGSSGDLYFRRAHPPVAAGLPMVIGAPDFDAVDLDRPASAEVAASLQFALSGGQEIKAVTRAFSPLRGVVDELEEVSSLLAVPSVTGTGATAGAIASADSPVVLHVATHGFGAPHGVLGSYNDTLMFGRSDPTFMGNLPDPLLLNGLAMSGANWIYQYLQRLKPAEDLSAEQAPVRLCLPPASAGNGLLLASDIAALDLRATELVVLSACLSAMGLMCPGEGNVGLRSAFALAGARSVICTLWRVPDRQTKDYIVEFYQRFLAGATRAEALADAANRLRRRYPEQPRFWAGFVCYGETGSFTLQLDSPT